MKTGKLILAFWVILLSTAITPSIAHYGCPSEFEEYVKFSLFFGRNDLENREVVSDEDWNNFLENTITPHFPAGLTVYDVRGQWSNDQGIMVRERTKIVMILVDMASAPNSLVNITTIVDLYKKEFEQSAVLVTIDMNCASFDLKLSPELRDDLGLQ